MNVRSNTDARQFTPKTEPPPRQRLRFHDLTVSDIRELTDEAVEVSFAVPAELRAEFSYIPGQHIALRTTIADTEIRRSYSLCARPDGKTLRIGVKEVPGGLFSTHVRNDLAIGDTISVMNPQGNFTSRLNTTDSGRIVAIVAGSGITPVMALASSVLDTHPYVHFTLLYGNRTSKDVMFLDDLSDLKDKYMGRLDVHHFLSGEGRNAELYSGRIDENKLNQLLELVIPPNTVDEWFLCGPLPLVDMARATLDAYDVDRSRVHFELFSTGKETKDRSGQHRRSPSRTASGPMRSVKFTLDGRTGTGMTPQNDPDTVLSTALSTRPDIPYACAGGVCGTCKAKLISGTVDMADNYALEPDELEAGFVLTCQSVPTSDTVEVDYDQ
ncbi:phenylacetate-CoA oxygenase/reductase subunit PaaK [Auritidibacter ignavus]|uniref:1,2-phenylacetyl-CoA epoxidase subunit PaaE n=1 Tax=Auritidibacter ignavus TaxID=678932 RepID=UPI000D7275EE|nr:1,2-phenylacetyl-CoA epoxidase subunit PaaE [Auritidibacter ignavus]PXA78529.1 phenylacetate-CoA oxygenase/reductase subunit PaaK [Auritidibacter sp. NML120779]WGH82230.1 phenylacetate-CoA oxygenase/reductase subunit PaaK [Auritidibacter ignavus]